MILKRGGELLQSVLRYENFARHDWLPEMTPSATPLVRPVAEAGVPPFEPHPWVRGGHAQTIAGRYLPDGRGPLPSASRRIRLDDGDQLLARESIPRGWRSGDPAALILHGLAGCSESPYVVRLAWRLLELGVRVVRLNLRGAGAGAALARGTYHAGRTDDVRQALGWLSLRTGGSPLALVGFSLGGNLALKLAAEVSAANLAELDCVLAANPPIDLEACARRMRRPENRIYDWNFVRWLRRSTLRHHRTFPELGPVDLRGIRSVYDFDDRVTAPRHGFSSAHDYYARCSSRPLIPQIRQAGLVVHAADDPLIPLDPLRETPWPVNLTLEITLHGGHLGYLSRHRAGGDRRWLELRMACWLAQHWGLRPGPSNLAAPPLNGRRCHHGVSTNHA